MDETVAASDLIVESGPEDMAFKQALFARIRAHGCDRRAARHPGVEYIGTEHLGDCRAMRTPAADTDDAFLEATALMPRVEIILGEKTSPEVARQVRDLPAACGKDPRYRQERPAGTTR